MSQYPSYSRMLILISDVRRASLADLKIKGLGRPAAYTKSESEQAALYYRYPLGSVSELLSQGDDNVVIEFVNNGLSQISFRKPVYPQPVFRGRIVQFNVPDINGLLSMEFCHKGLMVFDNKPPYIFLPKTVLFEFRKETR